MDAVTVLPFVNSLALFAGIVYFLISQRKERRYKRRVTSFYGNDTDSLINSKLAKIRFDFDADKAKLFQFHNGGAFLHGHAMKKMSLSYLQVKPGVAPPNVSRLQNLPTSFFPNMMNRFLEGKGVIVWKTKDAPDAFLRTRETEENVAIVMLASVWNKHNNLIGFISLNWTEAKVLEIDEPKLVQFADEIGELLDEY